MTVRLRCVVTVAILGSLLAVVPARVEAQDLTWDEGWERYSWPEGVVFGAVGAGALVWTLLRLHGSTDHWLGGILFDDAVRDAFRADAEGTREAVARVSDVGLVSSVLLPLSDLGVAWGAYDAPDVAGQMLLIDASSFATTILLTQMTKDLSGRERPQERQCRETEGREGDCDFEYRSFFSGHTSVAFTGAGLTCAHHSHLPLWGGGTPDRLACIGALTIASVTGLFRVISDKHYLTDVLTGAAIGLTAGWLLPVLLHYGWETTW